MAENDASQTFHDQLEELATTISGPPRASGAQYMDVHTAYWEASVLRDLLADPDRYHLHESAQHEIRKDMEALPDVSALQALGAGARVIEHLTTVQRGLVNDAREGGASWSQIGAALGMTKQGAQSLFARRAEREAE